jgi:hypothetical protein
VDPDDIGTEPVDTSSEDLDTSGPVETDAAPAAGGGGNPSWEPLRSKLGETTFRLIQDDLSKFDKAAESRISKLNQQLKTYSAFGQPDQIQTAISLAQRVDREPEAIYEALGQFLRDNGRMPQTQQEMQQVTADADEAEAETDDPRLRQLEQQQQQIAQFLQAQENERIQAQADAALQDELGALKGNPKFASFDQADIREVIQRAAFMAQTTGDVPPLEAVAQDYLDNTVNRIRSLPRPNDSAPRLVPTSGGGVPSQTGQPSLGQRSKQDIQDLVAGFLAQRR